jgi:PAS domain S-box-containing protein
MPARPTDGETDRAEAQGALVRSAVGADRMLELIHELEGHRAELSEQAQRCRQSRSELAATRDRYCEVYDDTPLGYLSLDRTGRVTRANRTALSLLGVERLELVGSRFDQLLVPQDAERLRVLVEDTLAGAGRQSLSVAFTHRISTRRRARVILVKTGGQTVHVSLREDQEPALPPESLSAEVLAVWDTLTDAVVTLDAQHRVRACNSAAVRLFGRPREALIGTPIASFIPSLPRQATSERIELFARTSDRKTTIPVEVAVTELAGSEGRLVAVISDQSERRHGLAEQNEAVLRFNQMVEHLEDAFYVAAVDGRSIYASPAFTTIFGRPLVALESEPWPRLGWVHPDDRDAVMDAAERLFHGDDFDMEYRVVHAGGETRLVHDRAFLMAGSQRITGIVRDVTEERRLAEELKKAQRLEAMGTLASGVAHDFNNLLMGIGGCVQLALRRTDAADPSHGYLTRAADAILRGANLTKQILRIGDTRRMTEGQVEIDNAICGARELIASLLGDSVELLLDTQAAGVRVVAEAADIEQILLNLVGNARDAMPKGGTLTLSTEVADDVVTFAVSDTGVGMSASVKARVFEPFFTTKRSDKGTGLGLATVFALVRRLGGTVALESSEGQGTTVFVGLPIARRASQIPIVASAATQSGGETVLVVDDDPLVRLTVENHLEALGYRALVASNAEEAIGFVEDENLDIDLLVTDVMMPGMLGPDLVEDLVQRGQALPTLYMSAHSRAELVNLNRLEPNARLLAKPFDASALGEALATVFDDARSVASGVRRRTLLVDDDRDTTDVLTELLELEGHEVRAANTPAEATTLALEFEPDVVLCDLDLKADKTGYELTRELRRDARLRKTTFVALTGYSAQEVRAQARNSGFARVLAKPLDLPKLRRLLRMPRL